MENASFLKVIHFPASGTRRLLNSIDGGESDLDLGNYERYINSPHSLPLGCRLTLLCKVLGPESYGGGQFFGGNIAAHAALLTYIFLEQHHNRKDLQVCLSLSKVVFC